MQPHLVSLLCVHVKEIKSLRFFLNQACFAQYILEKGRINVAYLTIIPFALVGYEMIDSQRDA